MIYAEPSLEKRRGLGILVDSKEKLSRIGGEVLYNQRGAAAEGKRKRGFGKTEALTSLSRKGIRRELAKYNKQIGIIMHDILQRME